MKVAPPPLAQVILLGLLSTFVIVLAIATALAGSLYATGASLLALPVAAALTTFRCSLEPTTVAIALSAPFAVVAACFAASKPELLAVLAWSGIVLAVFVVVLLSAYLGRLRALTLASKHAGA